MDNNNRINRRDFLKTSLAMAGAATFPLTTFSSQSFAAGEDYKAIVCVLLEGGADAFNMVVPKRNNALYGKYAAVRGDMALTQSELLTLKNTAYGFHPQMKQLQKIFNQNKLAVVANVGALIKPIDPALVASADQIYGQLPNLPSQLFAHNTQRELWMTGNAAVKTPTGWAARAADALDVGGLVNISVDGQNLMQRGGKYPALQVNGAIYAFDDFYRVRPPDTSVGEAYRAILAANANHAHKLVNNYANTRINQLAQAEQLSGVLPSPFQVFPRGVHESGKSLGEQLELVTRLIAARSHFAKRQIFFVNYHDWDTHQTPLASDNHKVAYLDECLGLFYQQFSDNPALAAVADKVTTFTISDFGRTTSKNSTGGTDHGWGGHAFVLGKAVTGGIYGKIPEISIDSPHAIGERVVPTTSIEQYLAPLVTWLGVSDSGLSSVFPNLSSFDRYSMKFMG
jgi:uncharacterized protein (DUF1501 family)